MLHYYVFKTLLVKDYLVILCSPLSSNYVIELQ